MSPARGWDDPWPRYAPSVPRRAEGGIVTRRQRGAMATTWWSQRFVAALEAYGLGSRMDRGRRYARTGQVLSVEVTPGVLTARVQGSRRVPYAIRVRVALPSAAQWADLEATLRSQVRFAARLLAGEVPPELEAAGAAAGVALFPRSWKDVHATCSCPDGQNPCKHIAAVLYVFADQLDADPWLLLAWRGRTREQVLAQLGVVAAGAGIRAREDGLPPWWPLVPGALGADGTRSTLAPLPLPSPATPPDRVLARLEPLGADVAGVPIVELLRPAYEALAADPGPVPIALKPA